MGDYKRPRFWQTFGKPPSYGPPKNATKKERSHALASVLRFDAAARQNGTR